MNPGAFFFDYTSPLDDHAVTYPTPRPTLLVDPSATSEILVSEHGRAVWPAGAPGALDALHAIGEICGATIETVRGLAADPAEDRREVVAALGDGTSQAARLYAHLTGRRVAEVRSVADLRALPGLEVVVTDFAHLTLELMEALYPFSPEGDAVPGILVGDDADALHLQTLVRAAAAQLVGPTDTRRIELLMPAPVGIATLAGVEVLGSGAPTPAILEALERGSGILSVVGHSDGIDTFLGNTILCSVDAQASRDASPGAPACALTGQCHRLRMPVAEAHATGRLVTADRIRTRILSYLVCAGTLLEDSTLDVRRALIAKLVANPAIGAILTPWSVVVASDLLGLRLSDELSRGSSVGESLARFHGSVAAHEVGTRVCLFGDPRVSLPASYVEPALFTERPSAPVSPATSPLGPTDLVVLQRCLAAGAAGAAGAADLQPAGAGAGPSPQDAVMRYLTTLASGGDPEASRDGDGHRMRAVLLDFALALGMLPWNVWVPAARPITGHDLARPCPHCARTAVELRFEFDGAPDRRLVFCARCGSAEDCPIDAPSIGLTLEEDSSITIRGPLGSEATDCLLMIRSANQSVTSGLRFRLSEGTKERQITNVKAPFSWPAGQSNLTLIVFVRDSFRIHSIPAWSPTARDVFPELPSGAVVVT